MKSLQLQYKLITELKPNPKNPRLHSKKQILQLENCIRKFGFTAPILTDDTNQIIAGHGRFLAAKSLGLDQVPTIPLSHLSKSEAKALMIADNKLTENSTWDSALLSEHFLELSKLDLDFDIEITGFETAEIDFIIDGSNDIGTDPADILPAINSNTPPTTKLGDVWQLGEHRLICGDSTNDEVYKALLGRDKAQAIFTDPPYNVKINGHVCGTGKIKHSEFAMASGEMTATEFTEFLTKFIKLSIEFSKDGSLHYICMDWRHIFELISAGKLHYSELKNICIWNKQNGGMGSLYRSKHEFVAVFKNGTKPHINNIELGKHGRYRTNVWDYAGVNSFGRNQNDLELHPTVKPVAMIVDAIKDCTRRKQIVLDPFAGSGSTLIACEKSQRVVRCIELSPLYCDVIIRRWQNLTGQNAIHLSTGKPYNQIKSGEQL